ncbi:MAG: UDP-N-acetylglucosamine--N-acetylmuramyl-(pentapeptide) pyrophosphoryl-undecaprenol N-acetylglucosamine transferase [Anaerolineaceae bacterium]|jgi:UDP-N-acetylglucosamine--N-acetylmuramyl-(pentapeptide) pyrophosphoryl-undecaprenol N-acetylglucosamine transferase|nr:UDP-N-acetylglucosamine--N-acetylmuramyl-(pentapeptide) pyrophosphoryl-undecaprenol N-acetylglucosamine transferase [Anaerolineaceae bacterium]
MSILQALGQDKDLTTLWVGGEGGMEADLVTRANVDYKSIPAAGVHGVGLRTLPGNLIKLLRGTLASRRILRAFKPDVILFTGGYLDVPMAVAGWRIPSLLYVPDIEPGMALKAISRFAARIALTTKTSAQYFNRKDRLVVTGYPTRADLIPQNREAARQRLGLHNQLPVILFFGGSKGAHTINDALANILPQLLTKAQVLHISGKLDWDEVQENRRSLPPDAAHNYHPMPYLHEMGDAFASADLVVSRAGAATLGEYPLFGLPAILIPYPYAWRYQRVNAEYLVQRDAALMIEDENMQSALLTTIEDLLASPEKLACMSKAMRSLAHPQAAQKLAGLVRELAGQAGEIS